MKPTSDLLEVLTAGYLWKHCSGLGAARTETRIAADLRDLGVSVRTRDLREAVRVLRLAGAPIGTSTAGVFVCIEPRDWRTAYRHLYTRLRTQAAGCRRFRRTFQESMAGQGRFDFGEGLNVYAELTAAPLLAAASGRGPLGSRR